MTRGNQREIDRKRAANRKDDKDKSKAGDITKKKEKFKFLFFSIIFLKY